MKIVIIGGGAAGLSTATRFRRLNENAEIIILEKSDEFAVSNCGLTYLLGGIVKDRDELIGTTVEAMKQNYNIEVRLNSEVELIDRENKMIRIAGRDSISYDKLVLATGSLQLRPDIEGVLSENVMTINDLASIERIMDFIKGNEAKTAVIVGGGFIGLETAEALINRGLKVSIIEASDHLLPPLDYDTAAGLHNYLRDKGVALYLNQTVNAFGEKEVTLSSGQRLAYDLAVIATGVKPDLKLPVMADLEIGEAGGIKVNDHMQTSDPDIYAAGDNVEVINAVTEKAQRMPLSGPALKQARVAADNLAGFGNKFGKAVGASICKFFEMTAAAVGCNEKQLNEAEIAYQKIHIYDGSNAKYYPGSEVMLLKLLFDKKGKILGAQGLGKAGIDKRIDVISALMERGRGIDDLVDLETAYAPPFSAGKDALNNMGQTAENVLLNFEKLVYFEEVDWKNQTNEMMLIDVRPQKNFLKQHIPGAINIPLSAIRNNLDSIPHEKQVILYCNRSVKAYTAARILINRGFDNIYVLSGGMMLYLTIEEDRLNTAKNYQEVID